MGYDEEFKKWMYKYYFRKGIFKYGLIGSLLAPVFILVFSTIDSFFLCSEDFYGLGFAGILCFLVMDLFIYGWGMIGAVVALKKDKVQTVLSGRPPEKQSIVIPSEDWKQGEIGELYNLANKKAKLAGMSVVIITILVISGLYIPRFYQSYCRKVEDIESINETETMIEEAFNGEDFYCESSLSSDSSKLENCYVYVKNQGNEDTMITLYINRDGEVNKINLTCDQKNDEDRIAVYKRLNDTYYKVMINIKENEIPLENSAWPENVPEVLEETFINGEDRVTRSDDSTSIHLSYVDSEEDREPFLKMMVESLD